MDTIKIINAHKPIIIPLSAPDILRLIINITLPKNEVEPIACPLGKLNPVISINRNKVGLSRSNIFLTPD